MGQRSEVNRFHAEITGPAEAERAPQRHGLTERHRRSASLIALRHNVADHAGATISRKLNQSPALGFAPKLPRVAAIVCS